MRPVHIVCCLLAAAVLLVLSSTAWAAGGNIDPTDKWAWGTNLGWINFAPTHGGVTIDRLTGSFDG